MGKIIAVASHKGGVGKTTLVLNLGYSLNRLGQRVLLVDADPQGGIAIASNLKKRTLKGIINLLKKDAEPGDIIIPTRDKTLSVAGIGDLESEDIFFIEKEALRGNLGRVIKSIAHGFDYILIDAPAGLGGLVTGLLTISDGVIITINCRSITVKTLPAFLKLVGKVRKDLNQGLRVKGIIINMFNEQNAYEQEVYKEIKQQFHPSVLFETHIPADDNFELASIKALPLALLPEGNVTASAYINLAIEFIKREIMDKIGGASDELTEGLF